MLNNKLWLCVFALCGLGVYGISHAKLVDKRHFDPEKIAKRQDLVVQDTPPPAPILPLPQNPPTSNQLPVYQQDRQGSPYSGYYSPTRRRLSPLLNLPLPALKTTIQLDSTGKTYNVSEKFGNIFYRNPSSLSFQQYQRMKLDSTRRRYWLGKDLAASSTQVSGANKNRLVPIYKLPPLAAKLFGGDNIDIKPMGQVLLDIGGRWQTIENPQIPVQQQTNGGLFFDQQIRLSLAGSIGERLKVNVNWDTKSTFQFENVFRISYSLPTVPGLNGGASDLTSGEAGIIKELNVGNVNMQSSNSLITGAQNLIGVQTKLQFGKLVVNMAAANQRGSQEVLVLRGGGQQREFELRADQYDFNRHFFLSDFFRNNYEPALRTIPVISGGVIVTRVEVYVTNRVANTQSLRNVAAFLDMGTHKPFNRNNPNIGTGNPAIPSTSNDANLLYQKLETTAGIRVIDDVTNILNGQLQLEKGTDYEVLRAARRLNPNEFTFHPTLGYVSLQTPVRNDEIVAVSYEYTYNGQRYTVGELTEKYQSLNSTDVIMLKMLKPSTIRLDLPTWDLMMKNIYSLNTNQISKDNFQLRIIYRDDLTGMDNPNLQEGVNLKNVPLVQVFGVDRLNQNNDPQPDGNFDFIAGATPQNINNNFTPSSFNNIPQTGNTGTQPNFGGATQAANSTSSASMSAPVTISPEFGRIIFPVLEPFGRTLDSRFLPEQELQFRQKYVFDELYRKTQMDAQLLTSKSKFFIKGSFQSATGTQIRLGINIAPRSVQITAGGTMLVEGTDYTVDYQGGTANIINPSIMASGKEIRIQYERADLFNFQTRNFFGFDAQYFLSKNTRFTATAMHLNERPLITRVNIGSEPTRNSLVGFGVQHRENDARFLTKMVDKLPLYSTKEKSTYAISSEVAALIPGTNQLIGKDGGTSFIDDFEAAEIPYDLGRQPATWQLGATPNQFRPLFNPAKPLEYSDKRAKLAWYNVDFTAFFQTAAGGTTPANITEDDKLNHYIRLIPYNEIVKPDALQINLPEPVMNLAYYPNERGQYNFNTNLNNDGTLPNPKGNFGSITKGITSDVDFDNINIQYVEFWLLDPFINGNNGKIVSKLPNGQVAANNNTTGGTLYFNLGNISEDVIPDSRHGFENGLPTDSLSIGKVKETSWGRVTEQQFLTNAFSGSPGTRVFQDVGMDGINDEIEKQRFSKYLQEIQGKVTPDVFAKYSEDPSNDNFQYYLGGNADREDLKILDRYKFYNGTENNSPENAGTASYTTLPDNEDLNRDNSLNDIDGYYEYKIDLKPGQIANSPYLIDKVVTDPISGTTDRVTWYQFRIPVREFTNKVGAIDGFKSIRYVRMYMTDWEQPVVLRMARFQFVGTPWRPFTESLQTAGLNLPQEPYNVNNFRVSSINIINNGTAKADNSITPYQVPPGFTRDLNLVSNTQARLNEQSLRMCVDGLADKDARAVYKNLLLDMVNYKRVKMFIHAESQTSKDGEMTAFLRLGTDFRENYYEVEVPLKMTPFGSTAPEIVWPQENEIDVAIADMIDVKSRRNNQRLSVRVPYSEIVGKYKITVIGNPDLSNVQTAMIGVRNPESADLQPKSVCIWANELRVAEFNTEAGWATRTSLQVQLADLARINASFRYVSPFFGGIQDKISQRSRNHTVEYDLNMQIQLDKFGLNKFGIRLPMYVGMERRILTPYFNPLDPDMPLSQALDSKDNRENYLDLVREDMVMRTINFTNVGKNLMGQKKAKPWSIENWSLNFAYMERISSNIRTAEYRQENTKLGLQYQFTNTAQPIEPFKKNQHLEGKYLKFIKDLNFMPLPNTVTVRGDFERRFVKTQLRDGQLSTLGVLPLYEKAFMFNRNYQVAWSLTKSLRLDYTAMAMAIIDEPAGEINGERASALSNRTKRDSVLHNLLNLGRIKNFTQSTSVTYKLPLDKFPVTNWIASDVKYTAGYTWTAGAVGIADSLGNTMLNNQSITFNGQLNMKDLYDKSRILKAVANPQKAKEPLPSKYEGRKLRLEAREKRLQKRKERLAEKLDNIKAEAQADSSLLSEKVREKFAKKDQKIDKKIEKVNKKLAEIAEKELREQGQKRPVGSPMRTLLKTLMMVQKINFSYTETNNTAMPGVLTTPTGAFGMSSAFNTPGWGFVFGSQDPTVKDRAAREGWLGKSAAQNNTFGQGTNQTLKIDAIVEPIKDLQIMLTAKRTNMANYQELFSYDRANDVFVTQTPQRGGQYSISYFSLFTAFTGDDGANNSPLFNDFIRNRRLVKTTLDGQNREGTYDRNAQDVLIPSFLAAYSGSSVSNQSLSAFPQIPLPNWKLTYNGLSTIPLFKPYFRSIQIEHSYQSEYSTGGYQSSLVFTDPSLLRLNIDLQNLPLAKLDANTNKLTPVFVMNQVTITEAFAPLVGVRIKTAKNISVTARYNMNRGLALNMSNSQVTELRNNELVMEFGFTKANFKIPFKIRGSYRTLKNDLTFACAFTIRDTKTAQRTIKTLANGDEVQESTVTQGNYNFQLRPTINYVINQRASLQFYFDHSINAPYVSNSFRRTNTAFGIQLRFNLQ
jgi:cell surface protein SprA